MPTLKPRPHRKPHLLSPCLPSLCLRTRSKFRLRKIRKTSLPLIRTAPCILSGWVSSSTAKFPSSSSPAPHWAELRGDVLLLYPAPQLLPFFEEHLARQCPETSEATLAALQHLQGQLVSEFAVGVDENKVLTFVMPVTKVGISPVDLEIVLRAAGGRGTTSISLQSTDVFEEWRLALEKAETSAEGAKSLSNFRIIRYIGGGASGRVFLVEENVTKERLALKLIEKRSVYESHNSYRHALDERLVLQMAKDYPYALSMKYAFQNARRLFIITEYCPNGDLFEYMDRKNEPLREKVAVLVTAQIMLALQHVHELGIVYRDLKLENVLLDAAGNIRLADFGLAKLLQKSKGGELKRTKTFCGTREYIAPEMINGEYYDQTLDLWSLGVLIYELLVGHTPFYSKDTSIIYDHIVSGPIFFPHTLSDNARDLLQNLLRRKPDERLGAGCFEEWKMHPWFKKIDWEDLENNPPQEGPFYEHSRVMKQRREIPDVRYVKPEEINARKSAREVKHEKLLQSLLVDVKEDEEYVDTLQRKSASVGGHSPTTARKPRSPLAKKAATVLAGYSFCSDVTTPRL